jgi:hypothetical protein
LFFAWCADRSLAPLGTWHRNSQTERTLLLDMWVIFMNISTGRGGSSFVEMESSHGCGRSAFGRVDARVPLVGLNERT